jgi:hypothetical protein
MDSIGPLVTELDEDIPIEHSAWMAVRCFETLDGEGERASHVPVKLDHGQPRFRYAHTAPAHFEIDGPVRPRRRETAYFIQRIEKEIVRNRGVLAADELAEYERALSRYRELARDARP